MCGIVGYIGHRLAQPVLLNSLGKLEYRGYDSCGIAVAERSLEVTKAVGRVVELSRLVAKGSATAGIGHTRWATHGAVTTANAHPHIDCRGRIAVVHNGIIENYLELRAALERDGHRFVSETDTEVLPHLIEKYYREGRLEEAVGLAVKCLVGSYAIIVIAAGSKSLVAARRDSPLVIGLGDRENFVASDVSAMLDYTDRVVYLEDGDICRVTADDVFIANSGTTVSRKVQVVPWTAEQVQKGGYEHFMLKEIHEQPKAVSETLAGRISVIEPAVTLDIEAPANPRNIVLTACGSSYHAALIGELLLTRLARVRARAVIASEFEQVEPTLDSDWVIAITQSGETADTLRATKKARAAGCATLAVVNVQGSTATRLCDDTLFVRAGPEVSVAATKTFIAQVVAMYLLALSRGTIDRKAETDLINELKLIPAYLSRLLDRESDIAQHGAYLARFTDIFFVARGINYPVALEGALKTKEISYVHAEAHPAGELKHGPFALLGPNMPVVALAPKDETYSLMQSSMKEIKARGSPVIAVVDEGDSDMEQVADYVIKVPAVQPLLSPILNTVVVQLISYYIAKTRGCPIDRPANLAKSVTVL
ncbi:MAG: glutamine--fructose-6-phosphate transaminase (isomerizing) [Chloroflexi bacterium]|nr:glutamine--fructose-6-phosphate transaminase (isomerizing) [Chloroflexota bacterium]